MKRKTSIFFLVPLFFAYSCSDRSSSIKKKFGIEQNEARKQLHLVAVDPGFTCKEDPSVEGRRYIFIHTKEEGLAGPAFLRKVILLDKDGNSISIEEDHFKNPSEKRYLVTTHDYTCDTTSITLQDIIESRAGRSSLTVSRGEADSILKSWKISSNPF